MMFKTLPGPNRERFRFKEQVLSHFNFLVEEYGFRCIRANVTFIRYESNKVFVNIYHGRASFEVGFEIGLLPVGNNQRERSVTLSEIVELESGQTDYFIAFCQASTVTGVEKCVIKIAGLVSQYARSALNGNTGTFKELFKIKSLKSDKYIKEMELSRLRERAVVAWKARNYGEIVSLYSPFRDDLLPSEIKKLEYAQKKLT